MTFIESILNQPRLKAQFSIGTYHQLASIFSEINTPKRLLGMPLRHVCHPLRYLTGVEWDWGKIYSTYSELFKSGKTLMNRGIPRVLQGTMKEGFSRISAYGPAVRAEAKAAVEKAKVQLFDSSLTIFKGELKDNKGKVVIPTGTKYSLQDSRLNSINWLVEGIVGDTGSQ